MALIHFWKSGNSQFKNEASSKTKIDAYHEFYAFMTILNHKLLICGEIPLYIIYIIGVLLYLSMDIGRYMILCGEMLQFAHKVSNF